MNEAKKIGLSVNYTKTKFMSNTTNISDNIKLIDQIEQVADFKYLGFT